MSGNRTQTKKRSMTFISVYYWTKLFGLNPLTLTKNNELQFSYFSIFYNCSLIVGYTYICYEIFFAKLRITSDYSAIMPFVYLFIRVISFFEVVFIWLTFSFRQNRIASIVKSFAKMHKNLKKMGIFENREKYIERLAIYLFVANGSLLLGIILDAIALTSAGKWDIILTTFYYLGRCTSATLIAIFAWCMDFARRQLRRLNEKVRSLMENDELLENEEVKIRNGLINTEFIRNSRHKQILLSDRISLVSKLHRELRDVIRLIEEHFELLILFNFTWHLAIMPIDIYEGFRLIYENKFIDNTYLFYMANISYWVVLPYVAMSVLVNVCGSTSLEANKTGIIFHTMLNNREDFGNSRESAKIIVLSLDLLQNPVRITLFGLIELDYSLLYRTIATATTYFVIMLQFYIQY